MARYFEADQLMRLSDDYPDAQAQSISMPNKSRGSTGAASSSQYALDSQRESVVPQVSSSSAHVFATRSSDEQDRAVRRRSSKGSSLQSLFLV